MDIASSRLFLPGCHISPYTAKLSLYAYLFAIHDRSIEKTWTS